MKLLHWTFCNLRIPTMKGANGVQYCMSKGICDALGISDVQLKNVLRRYGHRLHPVTIGSTGSEEFFRAHMSEFDLVHVREDMLLWPIKQAMGVALHVNTEAAWKFHQQAMKYVLVNAIESSM